MCKNRFRADSADVSDDLIRELTEEALLTGGAVWTFGSGRRVSRRPLRIRGG